MNLLDYAFMQRALLTALLTGLMAPAIGTYIVQRRLSLLGDGLGHVAIAGVGLAVMTGTATRAESRGTKRQTTASVSIILSPTAASGRFIVLFPFVK